MASPVSIPWRNAPEETLAPAVSSEPSESPTVVIAGNPNSGKSTLFNALTGLRQKVGNYPGVTVEKRVGSLRGSHGERLDLLDLPGTYSLQPRSPDEAVVRDVLLARQDDVPPPGVVVCVVDATNLERNLYLAAQLAELGRPMVVALTMVDLAERAGTHIDIGRLAALLGCPVVPVVAARRRGLVELRLAVTQQLTGSVPHRAPMPSAVEDAAAELAAVLDRDQPREGREARAEALLLLASTNDDSLAGYPRALRAELAQARSALARAGIDSVSALVDARYAWVRDIAHEVTHALDSDAASLTERLDRWLTHKIWGWVFFLGTMALMFFAVFRFAELPMGWIEAGQVALNRWLVATLPASQARDLLTDGVVAGVGGVVVFLPQILILFFFIGLLEDTGYMARVVFIIDRVMSRVGLHGRSFVPLLSSFACAIPGVMATRTIDNPKDRLVTILVAPLMSCSARLPVYTLMIAVLLPAGFTAWSKAGIMLGLYLLGMATAFAMAWLFRHTLLRGGRSILLMEIPPYRRPSLRVTFARMWERSGLFLKRAGTIILAVSIVIWALSSYPKPEDPHATPSQALAASAAGRLGHAIQPLIAPLGYDWKIGVGILSSFAAREVFVGTMSVLYSIEDGDAQSPELHSQMLQAKRGDGLPVYTPLVCLGLMVFYVLAMQCLSTVAIVRRETNSWKWPLFQIAYMSTLAWLAAFLVFQVGRLLGYT